MKRIHIHTAIKKNTGFLFILPLLLLCGCDKETGPDLSKGASLALVRAIASNVEYIQSIENETAYEVYPGITVTDLSFIYMRKPTRMLVAEIDLSKNITVAVSSPDNKTSVQNLQDIPAQAAAAENDGQEVWLAINGGQFNGLTPEGLFYKDGVPIKESATKGYDNTVVVTRDGKARICSVSEFQVLKRQALHVVGGLQRLMEDGEIGSFPATDNSMELRARTFVGTNMDASRFYMFVVEGSLPEYSTGIRLRDAMLICQGAGCYQAVNLDDGESSTMVVREENSSGLSFRVLNRLSQPSPKPVLNGLMVVGRPSSSAN